jgi:hypothetical protein
MVKKTILGLALGVWVGLSLTGCQSSDSGSGSRMLAKQSSPVSQPVTGYPYNPSANKGLGMSNTTNGSTSMSAANGIQQASAMQNASTPSTGPASSIPASPVSNFDQAGQIVSRPMGNVSSSSGPVPPTPPGSYALPPPNAYTPPANTEVPVRKPGDQQ